MRVLLCITLLALTAGCATTSTGEPVFRLRPEAPTEPGEVSRSYTGGFEAMVTFPDFDDVGTRMFKSSESAGFRVHARPTSWYVAPEIGVLITDEHSGPFVLEATEVFAGGRVTARLSEVPVELYASGGLSYLDSTVGPSRDTSNGVYFGGGTNLILGGDRGITIGLGYRFIDHDWDLDSWSEILFNVGLSW